MIVLIGCEESQAVCIEFRKRGFEAYSCDLKPCSGGYPEWHLQMSVFQALRLHKWDMVIFFPDCTYITCSAEWAYSDGPYHQNVKQETLVGEKRRKARNNALQFICDMLNDCERLGIKYFGFENPVGVIPQRVFKYYNQECNTRIWAVFPRNIGYGGLEATQYIQPYNFGEDASKKTGLWLFGLPKLKPTSYFEPRLIYGKKRWANQTNSGQNNFSPGKDRAELRSKTFNGIASAMADQWSKYIIEKQNQ